MDANANSKTGSAIQQPGEVIRPVLGEDTVIEIVRKRYGLAVTKIKELNSYDDRNFYIKVFQEGTNPHIPTIDEAGYVVKIYNSKDSLNPAGLDSQHAIMACFNRNNIPAQREVLNVDGGRHSLEEVYPDKENNGIPGKYLVEIRTFIPGKIIFDVPYTPDLLVQDGRLIANVTKALQDLDCPYLRNGDPASRLWSLLSVPLLTKYTFCLNSEDKQLIENIVDTFNTRVVAQMDKLPKGYVHGDCNEQNILVAQNASGDGYDISGILDFTDAEYTYPIIDLAMNIAYLMIDSDVVDQLETPGHILSGYLSVRTLTPEEWDVLVPAIAGRLAQSLTLGAHAHHVNPENTYVLTTAKKGWPLLKKFWAEPEEKLIMKWKEICK